MERKRWAGKSLDRWRNILWRSRPLCQQAYQHAVFNAHTTWLEPFTLVFLSLSSTLSVSPRSRASLFVRPPQIAYAKLVGSTLSESSRCMHGDCLYFQRQMACCRWLPSPPPSSIATPPLAKLDCFYRQVANDMSRLIVNIFSRKC